MEPTDKASKADPDYIDIPILHPPPRRSTRMTWIRRIVVWGVTLSLFIWVFSLTFRVIFPGQSIPANINPETGADKLPAASGEYVHQQAKDMLDEGRLTLRAGKISDGIARLQEVIKRHPASPQAADAYLVLAATYQYQKNDPAMALDTYLKFIGDHPQHTKVPYAATRIDSLGRELERQPSPAAAVPGLLLKAMDRHAENYRNRLLLLNLAVVYERPLRDLPKALQTYRQFIEQFPDDPRLPRAAAGLRKVAAEMKQPDPAPELLKKALEKVEDNPAAVKRIKRVLY